MLPLLLVLLLPIGCVSAAWQTLYTSNLTQAFVQSTNGSLYILPIRSKPESTQNVYSDLEPIANAPSNSSLVLDSDGHLFAVWGSKGCGKSPIEISQYNAGNNQWTSLAQSSSSQLWYQESQIVWLDRSNDTIYIYGGECNGKTQSGFYSYNLGNNTFNPVNAHGGAMPREMSAAQAVPLDDYQTLIIGGRANGAWLSMQQVAIWGYGSWEFSSVANSTGIDSRDNPLLLPMWQDGQTGPIDRVLIVGGTVAGRKAKPQIALLSYNATTGWVWSDSYSNEGGQIDLSYAGAVLYETFASINPGSSSSKLALYGNNQQNMLAQVQAVKVPKSKDKGNSDKKTSTAVIAVVSTVLPIIALCLVGAGAWWWWRRRQERRLLLLPNRRSMMRMHDRTESEDTRRSWNVPPLPTRAHAPATNDSGSVVMMDLSDENQIYMSRQRRNLRVVNPDAELEEARAAPGIGTRESSWSSGSAIDPFSDGHDESNHGSEQQSEFDFGL